MCGKVFPSSTGIDSKPVKRRTRSLIASITNLTNNRALKKLKSTIGQKNKMMKINYWLKIKLNAFLHSSLTPTPRLTSSLLCHLQRVEWKRDVWLKQRHGV